MNLERPKQLLKIGAFVVLSSLPAFAQTKDVKTEDLKQMAKDSENKIILQMAEHGQKGRFGNMDVKKMTLADGSQIIVGYDASGKEVWVMKESREGRTLYLDENMDGDVDGMVLNKEGEEVYEEKGFKEETRRGSRIGFNELKAFTPIDELSEQAKIEAGLDPEKVFVYRVVKGPEGGFEVIAVNFSTGETEKVTGSEAEKQKKRLQEMFVNSIK